jgi:hypothetical protein
LTAAWVQAALAALCLLTLAFALVTALRLRTIRDESTMLGETDTRTIVKLRLLESRVSELESAVADIERWRGSIEAAPDVIDLRGAFPGRGHGDPSSVVRAPDAE